MAVHARYLQTYDKRLLSLCGRIYDGLSTVRDHPSILS